MQDTTVRNDLIRSLPDRERQLLVPLLEPVPLPYGMVVKDVNTPAEHVYFPDSAIISSVAVMADGSAVETSTTGREGMAPIALFHGVAITPEHLFVQVPGEGHRLRAEDFRRIIGELPVLGEKLRRYTAAMFTLLSQSSGCNRKHSMVQRCARWLLLTRDMLGRDRFAMTHLVLSQMLGVRRASVTEAALALQNAGAIEYSRGTINVRDIDALERASCECYGIVRAAYERLLHDRAGSDPLAELRLSAAGISTAGDGAPRERRGQLEWLPPTESATTATDDALSDSDEGHDSSPSNRSISSRTT